MTTYIALLRGINVGKAKRIAMADLRALLEGLGHTDVATLLNSGNVVFKVARKGAPRKLAADISAAIAMRLGIEVPVIVVSATELALIVRENPFALADDPSRLLVAFVADAGMLSAMSRRSSSTSARTPPTCTVPAASWKARRPKCCWARQARPPPPATGPPC